MSAAASVSVSVPAADLGAVKTRQQAADDFTRDLLALMARDNRSCDGTLVLPSEYLEAVVVRD